MLTRYHSVSRQNGHSASTAFLGLYSHSDNGERSGFPTLVCAISDRGSGRILGLLHWSGSHHVPDSLTTRTNVLVSIIAFVRRIIHSSQMNDKRGFTISLQSINTIKKKYNNFTGSIVFIFGNSINFGDVNHQSAYRVNLWEDCHHP